MKVAKKQNLMISQYRTNQGSHMHVYIYIYISLFTTNLQPPSRRSRNRYTPLQNCKIRDLPWHVFACVSIGLLLICWFVFVSLLASNATFSSSSSFSFTSCCSPPIVGEGTIPLQHFQAHVCWFLNEASSLCVSA